MKRYTGGLGNNIEELNEDIKFERDTTVVFAQCKILPNVLKQEQNWCVVIIICR
jgi:hypothetical protein